MNRKMIGETIYNRVSDRK